MGLNVIQHKNVFIVSGPTGGYCQHVCQFIQHILGEQGAKVTICDAAQEPPDPLAYDACFIGKEGPLPIVHLLLQPADFPTRPSWH